MRIKRGIRFAALGIAALIMAPAIAGCGGGGGGEATTAATTTAAATTAASTTAATTTAAAKTNGTHVITDMRGREVEIPDTIGSIICLGAATPRFVSYLDATDMMIGIEESDTKVKNTKRDYAYVYQDQFSKLPVVAEGGGTGYKAFPEEIVTLKPDIILTNYNDDALEQVAKETGIPVVGIKYDGDGFLSDDTYEVLRFIAGLLGKEEKCEKICEYMDKCKKDLDDRTKDFKDEDKPKVYSGAVTFSGAHGFAGTCAHFGPFEAVHALNVVDETGEKDTFEVDLEKVSVWDPDIIFLDPGNMNLVNEEYKGNPSFFDNLSAVKNGELYTMPSSNNYHTNVTYMILNAYWAGKVLYPDAFKDVDMKAKGNETFSLFLGKEFFDQMEADGYFYGKLTIGE